MSGQDSLLGEVVVGGNGGDLIWAGEVAVEGYFKRPLFFRYSYDIAVVVE